MAKPTSSDNPIKTDAKLTEDFMVSCLATGGKLQLSEGGMSCSKPVEPAATTATKPPVPPASAPVAPGTRK